MSSYEKLLKKIQKIQNEFSEGKISILDEDLKKIFLDLKNITTPEKLRESINLMEGGTGLLQKKISEFEKFILILNKKEEIYTLLQNTEEDGKLSHYITQSYQNPFSIPHFSMSFLMESFQKLVKRKKKRNKTTSLSVPDDFKQKTGDILNVDDSTFKQNLNIFFKKIKKDLPSTLEEILRRFENVDQYYEHFTYLLHLIQKGYLYYDKEERKIHARK